jgi:hypothetical protein
MGIIIDSYSEKQQKAVAAFNQRLRDRGVNFSFPESHISSRWPRKEKRKLFEDYYLAMEEDAIVRGGYILKHQDIIINGKIQSVGNIQLPLSEGTINNQYNWIGLKLHNDALRRQPNLYALGMGGVDNPFPKFLKSMGWNLVFIPFYFYVVNPVSFLRNISALRQTKLRSFALDFLAYSGIGFIGIKAAHQFLQRRSSSNDSISIERVNRFDQWVDDIWQDICNNFVYSAVRDLETLDLLYPEENATVIRLKVTIEKKIIGWLLILDTAMKGHRQFNNMRVGSLIDCLALKGYELQLMKAASIYLRQAGVDLIITNQAYQRYGDALTQLGFMKGPSNFIFATSKKLSKLLDPSDKNLGRMHINRGDGDGPMHL